METGQKTIQKNNNIDLNTYKRLSIQVSLSGLSFCILDTGKSTVTYYKEFPFDRKLNPGQVLDKLIHSFNSEPELQGDFNDVHVIHVNELSALVPTSLFNEDHLADYLKFNSRIIKTDYITYDTVSANDSVNVYVPYVNINNFIYDKFGEFEFKHFSTILVDAILHMERNATAETMYVNVCEGHFEILVTKNNSLLLYNTFEYHTKEDFIYYVLFTAEQLQLNPETFQLTLAGAIKKDDDLYEMAYKYVRHITFAENPASINIASDVEDSIHQNFVLLNSF